LLKLVYLNARSVLNKFTELQGLLSTLDTDIVLITEAWLNSWHTDIELNFVGFRLFCRKDRVNTKLGRGAGVVILSKEGL
jgi:hypothetical protein